MNWQKIKDVIAIIIIWLVALSMAYIVYLKVKLIFH